MNFSDLGKMKEMMSQAKVMQEQMEQKLSSTVVEAEAGAGMVRVRMNGKKELLKLRIDPSAVSGLSSGPQDVEMLEDLIVAAVNDAGRKAEEALQGQLKGMLGGLNLPGLG